MALNKQHPDCKEYTRKWDELWAQMDEELSKATRPQLPMRDGGDMARIHKKYAKQLKALQVEYAHLFSDDIE